MFEKARIKLTAWYLLIIMMVSISFSVVIYHGLNTELDRLERVEQIRIMRRQPELLLTPPGLPPAVFDPDIIAETRQRILLFLTGINALILAGSAVAGYFLAGRTLRPIADMVDEQNRFITDASHELRTPLTALKSEIEVNLRNPKLDAAMKKLLMSNLEEVNNLQSLSDNLIKLSSNGKTDIPVEPVRIASVTRDALRRVSALAKSKSVTVSHTVADITVQGNAGLLTELLVILLDNAIKYSKNGDNIMLTAKKTDGHVSIRVSDRGVGIHKDDLPHIFDRFYRADKSRTKSDIPGYGLGLAIAKQIVDKHVGTIHIESTLGKGTAVSVRLPIS